MLPRRPARRRPAPTSEPGLPALFDSHCHLQDSAFDGDRADVLARAYAAGVREIVTIASTPEDADRARALIGAGGDDRPAIWSTAGLHPHEAARWSPAVAEAIAERLEAGAVAVGETGLDYHYDHGPREAQREAFVAQLALARARDLPVVVHSREAEADTLALLEEAGLPGGRVVLHCFSGSRAMLETAVDRGYVVSFSGLVTFRGFPAGELVPLVPETALLAETDAPYLAPVPHRGRRNEPAFLAATVAALADLRGAPAAALAARLRDNARRFYRLA